MADGEVLARDVGDGAFEVVVGFVDVFVGQRDAVAVGAFDEFGDLAGGGVQVSAVAGAGHGDVDGFAVEAGGSDEEHAVAGEALGFVDRGGVAVIDVAGAHVAGGDAQPASVDQSDVDVEPSPMDGGDGADHPVVDAGAGRRSEVEVAVGRSVRCAAATTRSPAWNWRAAHVAGRRPESSPGTRWRASRLRAAASVRVPASTMASMPSRWAAEPGRRPPASWTSAAVSATVTRPWSW